MKRLFLTLALAAATLFAQEHGEAKHEAAAEHHEAADPTLPAKWTNFAILAGALGFLAIKLGGPALRGQQKQILADLNQAATRAEAAAAEAAEIDRKISGLGAEVDAIRKKADAEMAHEAERIQAETAQMLAKVDQSADVEIASALKHATSQLKATAAQLALDLATQKVQAQITPQSQGALVDRFVNHLKGN